MMGSKEEVGEEEEREEGRPPCDSVPPPQSASLGSRDLASKEGETEAGEVEPENGDTNEASLEVMLVKVHEGGGEGKVKKEENNPSPSSFSIPTPSQSHSEMQEFGKKQENKEEGEVEEMEEDLPPGYLRPITPHQPSNELEKQAAREEKDEEKDEDGPPPGYSSPARLSREGRRELGTKQEPGGEVKQEKEEEDGPPPGYSSYSSPRQQPSNMAQMVCGSCQRLLVYPQGVRHVRCSCCGRINVVLEAHQVGQVKCGGCALLLMYPYGATSVRCSSCRFVTDIGVHNRRPPLSVQQAQAAGAPYSIH